MSFYWRPKGVNDATSADQARGAGRTQLYAGRALRGDRNLTLDVQRIIATGNEGRFDSGGAGNSVLDIGRRAVGGEVAGHVERHRSRIRDHRQIGPLPQFVAVGFADQHFGHVQRVRDLNDPGLVAAR